MANKSTPLSQLNSERKNPNDSQLVNEILAEIGNEQKSEGPSQEEIMKQKMYQEKMLEQQMLEQQQYEQQMYEQQMRQQQLQQQQLQQQQQQEYEQKNNVRESESEPEEKPYKSLKIAGMTIEGKLKGSLLVAVICLALAVPAINKMISSLLPNKEFILNNTNTVVAVIKGVIAGGAFYLASDC